MKKPTSTVPNSCREILQKCLFTIILAKSNKSSFLRCIISYKPDRNKKSPKESSKRPFNFSRCMVYRHLCLVHNDSCPDSAQCYRMAKIENNSNVLKILCVISKAGAFYKSRGISDWLGSFFFNCGRQTFLSKFWVLNM